MRYTRLPQNLEVMRHRALRNGRIQGAAGNLVDAREYPDYLEPNRVAQSVQDVGKADVLESRVVEVPQTS